MNKQLNLRLYVLFLCQMIVHVGLFAQSADSIAREARFKAMENKALMEIASSECKEKGCRFLHHVVERGETWESIAAMYGVDFYHLFFMNSIHDSCYVGLDLVIPVVLSDDGLKEQKLLAFDSRYQQAQMQMDNSDYSAAIKTYSELIEARKGTALSYYNRGIAFHKEGKLKKALADFATAQNYENQDIKESASHNYHIVAKELEEKWQRRAEAWGNFLNMGVQIAGTYLQAQQQILNQGNAMPKVNGLGSMSDAEFSSYVTNSLTQIANASVIQVQQQVAQEEVQIKNSFVSCYRRIHGCDPTPEEVQAAYDSFMQTKVNAHKTVQMASSGMYDKELGIESSTSFGYKCKQCNDTHVCRTCNGSGWQSSMFGDIHDYGGGIGKIPCGNCSDGKHQGSGKCRYCK